MSEIQSFECILTLSAELVLKTDLVGKGSWVNLFWLSWGKMNSPLL